MATDGEDDIATLMAVTTNIMAYEILRQDDTGERQYAITLIIAIVLPVTPYISHASAEHLRRLRDYVGTPPRCWFSNVIVVVTLLLWRYITRQGRSLRYSHFGSMLRLLSFTVTISLSGNIVGLSQASRAALCYVGLYVIYVITDDGMAATLRRYQRRLRRRYCCVTLATPVITSCCTATVRWWHCLMSNITCQRHHVTRFISVALYRYWLRHVWRLLTSRCAH